MAGPGDEPLVPLRFVSPSCSATGDAVANSLLLIRAQRPQLGYRGESSWSTVTRRFNATCARAQRMLIGLAATKPAPSQVHARMTLHPKRRLGSRA